MSGATYFVQECPICGRCLQVRLEFLGREVVCEHCNGGFQATDPALRSAAADNSAELLSRVDQLLASVDQHPPADPPGIWSARRQQPIDPETDDASFVE